MEVNRINNTSFKGISMPKKVVLMPIGMEFSKQSGNKRMRREI